MSARVSHHPLVVNTVDGSCWLRRAVTSDGRGLYALAGSAEGVPDEVLTSLAELAELGITGSAFALPVPVGPAPQALDDKRLAQIRNRRLDEVTAGPWLVADGDNGRPVVYVERPMPDGRTGALVLLAADGASEADVQFVASARRSVPELVAEVDRLQARVAELEAERHTTNEALDDAVQALRADRDEPAAAYVSRLLPPRDAVCARPGCGHSGEEHHHGDTKCWAHLPRVRNTDLTTNFVGWHDVTEAGDRS